MEVAQEGMEVQEEAAGPVLLKPISFKSAG